MTENTVMEMMFSVGLDVMVFVGPAKRNSPRYITVLRGWRKGSHIILDRPKVPEGSFVALQEGLRCTIQFVREGMACSFEAEVIDWDNRRFNPYLRLRWPSAMRSASFRRFERIKMNVPCTLLREGVQSEGKLSDLSAGGGSVRVDRAFPAGTLLDISFSLPDGCAVNKVRAIVRSVQSRGGHSVMGCEFEPGQEAVENDIAFYAMMALATLRGDMEGGGTVLRVLAAEHETALSLDIRRVFEKAGFSVFVADNLVDAMYRLRMSAPVAVLVNQGFSDLAGTEFCRILKSNPDFAQMPVYVYGGKEAGLAKRVMQAGGAHYFPESAGLFETMANTLAKAHAPVKGQPPSL